jgi:hypothetical protein
MQMWMCFRELEISSTALSASIQSASSRICALVCVCVFDRLFKLPSGHLEPGPEEDYGQTVTYTGGMGGDEPDVYRLDMGNTFSQGGMLLCSSPKLSGMHTKLCFLFHVDMITSAYRE